MRGFHQRGFAHSARAPEQSVVGWQSLSEALRIGEQQIAGPVDSLEQAQLDTVDLFYRSECSGRGSPDEG